MSDTERVDHGDAIKRHAHRVRGLADALTEHAEPITMAAFGNIEDATTAIERHADALDAARVAAEQRGRFARLVEAEREYQRDKWGANDNMHTWPEWGAILGEEYGEVCRALKAVHWQGERADAAGRHGLRGELVQLAAICAAMIERIDGDLDAEPGDTEGEAQP